MMMMRYKWQCPVGEPKIREVTCGANKGDDLVITTGRDEVDYSHKISAPVEIWELQDNNGKAVSLEVIDRNGAKTIIVFKS